MKPEKQWKFPRWLVVVIVLAGVGVASWGMFLATSGPTFQATPVPTEKPALEILPPEYDLGAVSVASGEVHTDFTLRNVGNADLVVQDMDTSCGCTAASIVVGGREGPRFNMRGHGRTPQNWSLRLAHGQEAELRVYYNPQVHPELRGAVIREVYLFGSDLRHPLATVRIRVNQVN